MEFVAMGDIAKQIEVSASNAAELSGLLKMLENEWEMLLNELK
jgi:hypothetical protein